MIESLVHITLNPTGRVKRTGYGDLLVFTTPDEKPRVSHSEMGIVYLDIETDSGVTGWIWIDGPTWEAMLNASPGRSLIYTGVMGGIQDKN